MEYGALNSSNMEFCNTRRELIAQVMMGSINDDSISLPKSFYNAIRASVSVACVVQYIPMGKAFEQRVGYSPATLKGVLLFLQDVMENDLKEIIRRELSEIMSGYDIDPHLGLYFNDQFVDGIEYLSVLVKENREECEQMISTAKYLETRVEEMVHLLNILKKYDS